MVARPGLREMAASGPLGCRLVRVVPAGRVHWIYRRQLDVEIPEQFERAVQAGLVGHPSDQVGESLVAAADFEAIDGCD